GGRRARPRSLAGGVRTPTTVLSWGRYVTPIQDRSPFLAPPAGGRRLGGARLDRLAQAGLEVPRHVAQPLARLVVLRPVGHAVGDRDQLLEVRREAHDLAHDRSSRGDGLQDAGREVAPGRLAARDL